jgi:ketosteroid isomerase-like protein
MSEKEKLLDTFQKFRQALFACDVPMLKELMDEEYVGFDPQGNSQDLQMTLEAYQPGCVQLDTYDVEELETKVIGEVGIITGKGYIHGTFTESEFEHSVRFLDLYILREEKWRLYLSQVTPMDAV